MQPPAITVSRSDSPETWSSIHSPTYYPAVPPQVWASLSACGVSNLQLDLGSDPLVAETALTSIPPGTRVLLLYISPDKQSLYLAALNIPDDQEVLIPAATPPVPPPKGGKGSEVAPAPPVVTKCLIEVVPIDMTEVERLRNDIRAYRRDAEKKIRESVSAAVAAGWTVPGEVSQSHTLVA